MGKQGKDSEGWASAGDHVIADPATLRGYGRNIAKLRFDFQSDTMQVGMSLRGIGRDNAISTGTFEPGMTCDALVDSNSQEMSDALRDFVVSLTAIPAAILTMADLFDGSVAHGKAMINAQCDAMLWAFATPGADRPTGVPSYIKGTIKGEMAKYASDGAGKGEGSTGLGKLIEGGHYSGADVAVYAAAGGGRRYVVRTPGGGYMEWGEDKNGVRTYQTIQQGNGPVVNTQYSEGKEVSVTKRYKPTTTTLPDNSSDKDVKSVHDERQLVEKYEDGKKTTTTDHVVVTKYSDGTETHTYATETGGKRTEDGTVGRQPPETTPESWAELARRQGRDIQTQARGL